TARYLQPGHCGERRSAWRQALRAYSPLATFATALPSESHRGSARAPWSSPKSTGCSKTPEIHARSDEPRRPQPQPAHGWFPWLASVRTGVALTLVSDEEHELLDLRPLRHTAAE